MVVCLNDDIGYHSPVHPLSMLTRLRHHHPRVGNLDFYGVLLTRWYCIAFSPTV